MARLDGATGRVVWERTVGDRANGADIADGLLWVHSSTARDADRLTALSLEDGSTVSSTALDHVRRHGPDRDRLRDLGRHAGRRTLVLRR